MSFLAVVLAAGAGRRMGRPKALLRVDGESFLARCTRVLRRAHVARVAVVVGHAAAEVTAEAQACGADGVLRNEHPDDGMLGSILLAVEHAAERRDDGLLVLPVDHPLVEIETVDGVLAALRSGARIAVPSFEGRRGHPTGFAASTFEALRGAAPERGARAVLADHPDWITYVPGGRGCRRGVNTPEDYAALVGRA